MSRVDGKIDERSEADRPSTEKGTFYRMVAFLAVLSIIALYPLYGVVYPLLTDLQHHVLVNKLVWEHLSGSSRLDLELSWYLGYRLPTLLIVPMIGAMSITGVSLIWLPKLFSGLLMLIHACTMGLTARAEQVRSDLQSSIFTGSFILPAVVFMYSACWFMGFVGYTLAITLLVPAILLTERYLADGGKWIALLLFAALVLVYLAHPFGIVFWGFWCICRGISALLTLSIKTEWKRFFILIPVVLPVLIYQYAASAILGFPSNEAGLFTESPILVFDEWYKHRFSAVLAGTYLQTDNLSGSVVVTYGSTCVILLSLLIGLAIPGHLASRKKAITLILFISSTSWISEKLFPVPNGHWLAFNYRFASTVLIVSLAVSSVILIRSYQAHSSRMAYKIAFSFLAFLCTFISVLHLHDVREGNLRFDAAASTYMNAKFDGKSTVGMGLPETTWYTDPTFLRRYDRLTTPDCNPAGTLFRNLGGDVYPVKLVSQKFDIPPPQDRRIPPVNAFVGGEGYVGGRFSRPRGIAVDRSGNFYVADTGNHRVQKFNSSGGAVLEFGTSGDAPGLFKDPASVAIDGSGYVYVADPGRRILAKYGSDGAFITEWRATEYSFANPIDISFGADGQLYILDDGPHQVIRFTPELQTFSPVVMSGSPRFERPTGIDVSGDLILVADAGADRVFISDLNGRSVSSWAVTPWSKYRWHYPDIAYEAELGLVFVSSGWSKEVLIYTIKGELRGNIPLPERTELNNVCSIAVSKNDGKKLLALSMGSDTVDNGDPLVSQFELKY